MTKLFKVFKNILYMNFYSLICGDMFLIHIDLPIPQKMMLLIIAKTYYITQ